MFGQYGIDLGSSGKVDINSSLSYIDDVYFTVFEAARDQAPSYFRWDARVTWQSTTGKYSASAFVNNILDDIGIRQVFASTEQNGWRRSAATTEPRIFGLELQYKLGPEY